MNKGDLDTLNASVYLVKKILSQKLFEELIYVLKSKHNPKYLAILLDGAP